MAEGLAEHIMQPSIEEVATVDVSVSYEVVRLFSEQLYASPLKAIEELVVNSWDAMAKTCSVLVRVSDESPLIAVLDDGTGMTPEALKNLWMVGTSNKLDARLARKQIGKFGIGKLASYAVARHATYISKSSEGVHAVSINFDDFNKDIRLDGNVQPVRLSIRKLGLTEELFGSDAFKSAKAILETADTPIDLDERQSWTLVVLEQLKPKAMLISTGRLQWVLETAMPFASDFSLYLNGDPVSSSKDRLPKIVNFSVTDLSKNRLKDLNNETGESWEVRKATKKDEKDALVCTSFPSGVSGNVYVTNESLYKEAAKSQDLGRSNGFFVRVHNRLINEADPLFGAKPLSYTTFNRFAAVVEADDLNQHITASRDDVEQTKIKYNLRSLLVALFYEARDKYEKVIEEKEKGNKSRREGQRDYVSVELVERPLADALTSRFVGVQESSDELAEGWKLIDPPENSESLEDLVEQLYSTERKKRSYTYKYSASGSTFPLVKLDPVTSTFTLNEDHQLVIEFADRPESKRLLEAIATAEALLEIHLRGAGMPNETVFDLLDRRDSLLRSLALDNSFALPALARALRSSEDDEHGLEVAVVGAMRALGFSARHVSGSGTPDGVAGYVIHGFDSMSFTLEAKSSSKVPELSQLDFAGLRSHFEKTEDTTGCLLVAPTYPGKDSADSEVSRRAVQQKVSCWTIDQLAKVVESAERRHINARQIQKIIFEFFDPASVSTAVENLLSEPIFDKVDLYKGVLRALENLQGRLVDTPRSVSILATELSGGDTFATVTADQVRDAVLDLARSSKGMLHLADNDVVTVLGDINELKRRVSHLTSEETPPRRGGTFRDAP